MDSNDRGILTLLAKGMRDLRAQVSNLARQPGPAGKDGQDGKDGLDGKDGIGLRGLAGTDGADGARGPDGPQGVPGANGERGPVGPMPKHEWKGTQLRFQQTDSKWGKWTDLQGKPGKAGSGGVLSGTYPNPGFAVDMVTQSELDAHTTNNGNPHSTTAAQVGADPAGTAAAAVAAHVAALDPHPQYTTAAQIHAAASKTTPVDADELGLSDSAASWGLKKLTFANLKAVLLAYFKGQFREKLTADRAYYVRSDGSDSNTGLANTSGGAFLTIQKAIDTVAALDLGIYDVATRCTGVFTATVTLKTLFGAGKHIIRGANDDTTTMTLTVAGGDCFYLGAAGFSGIYQLQWMKLSTTTSGNCVSGTGGGGAVFLGNLDFGACAGTHIQASQGQIMQVVASYTISGGAVIHAGAYNGGLFRIRNFTVTLTGTPAFSSAFAVASRSGVLMALETTYTGSATGNRYDANLNGVILTAAGGTFLPGNTRGTTATGGQYA